MAVKRKVRKGAARTAKQKAALKKAQLVSARKRKGKGNSKSKAARIAKNRRRAKQNAVISFGVAGAAAASIIYSNRRSRKMAYANARANATDYAARARQSRARANAAYERLRRNRDYARARYEETIRDADNLLGPRRVPSTRGPGRPLSPQLALPVGRSARGGPPKPKPRKGGAPSSRSEKAGSARIRFDHARLKPHFRRQDAIWRAKKKRGLFTTGHYHSKAKFRRRNEAKRKKKG